MASPNPVKVLEVCRVTPMPSSLDSTIAQNSLPLTFFDLHWLRFPPSQRLFFYEASYPSHSIFSERVLPKLKHSLSVTLQHYLPLAGNLTWPPDFDKPIIQHVEGDAVSLTIAESEVDFYHLSGNSFREAKELHPFLPCLMASDTRAPVMALQITLFPNAGFCIGYAIHHAVLDGKTAAMFMHSWASMCRCGGDSTPILPEELTPLYDRTLVNDPADLERTYLNVWLEQNGPYNNSLKIWDLKAPPDTMLGTFHLTRENIENMKKWVQSQWQEKHNQKPVIYASNFAIMSAYIWVCLVKAQKPRTATIRLAINIDCRGRLEPPLPSTYFGNCIVGCMVDADTNDLIGVDGYGLAIAVKAIGEAIEGLKKDGVLKGTEDSLSTLFSIQKDELFSIAGSPRFELYNTDFGWGRPKKVEMISNDKSGAFCLSDSKESIGGVEIGIVLKKHETEAFTSLFASGLQVHSVK